MTPASPLDSPWKATQQGRVRTAVDAYNASHDFLARLDAEDLASSQERCKAAVERVLSSACRATWNHVEEVLPRDEWEVNDSGVPVPEWRAARGVRRSRWGCGCASYVTENTRHNVLCHGCDKRASACTCDEANRSWTSDPDSTCDTYDTDPPKVEPITNRTPPYQGGPPNPATFNFSEDPETDDWWHDRTWSGYLSPYDQHRPHTAPYTCGAPGCGCEDVLVMTRSEWEVMREEQADIGERRRNRRRKMLEDRQREQAGRMAEGVSGVAHAAQEFGYSLQQMSVTFGQMSYSMSIWGDTCDPDGPAPVPPRNRAERRGSGPRLRTVQRNRVYQHRPLF